MPEFGTILRVGIWMERSGMRLAVLLLALAMTGCALWPERPIVEPAPFLGEPTGADTGSVR